MCLSPCESHVLTILCAWNVLCHYQQLWKKIDVDILCICICTCDVKIWLSPLKEEIGKLFDLLYACKIYRCLYPKTKKVIKFYYISLPTKAERGLNLGFKTWSHSILKASVTLCTPEWIFRYIFGHSPFVHPDMFLLFRKIIKYEHAFADMKV